MPVTYPQGKWTAKGGSITADFNTDTKEVSVKLPLSNYPAVYLAYNYIIKGVNTGITYLSGIGTATLGQGDGLNIIESFSGLNSADEALYIEANWTDSSVTEQPTLTGQAFVDTSIIF